MALVRPKKPAKMKITTNAATGKGGEKQIEGGAIGELGNPEARSDVRGDDAYSDSGLQYDLREPSVEKLAEEDEENEAPAAQECQHPDDQCPEDEQPPCRGRQLVHVAGGDASLSGPASRVS